MQLYTSFSLPYVFASAAGHAGAVIDQMAAHFETTALTSCRCVCVRHLLKPRVSAFFSGHAGAIIDQIAAHFEITALQQHILDQANAVEFLEVYKGVVPEYNVSARLRKSSDRDEDLDKWV